MHAAFVYQVAYSVLRDAHDAEDVAQETFVRVMKNADRLETIRDERAWLARIAWRLAITRWTKTRRRRNLEVEMAEDFDFADSSDETSESRVQSQEMLDLLDRLTMSLPPDLRHTLSLLAVDDMNTKEVADILNISEITVRTRMHRAKKLLKAKVKALLPGWTSGDPRS
jgi:RNA polymerase sigma-70 factor (ECF subfamily)